MTADNELALRVQRLEELLHMRSQSHANRAQAILAVVSSAFDVSSRDVVGKSRLQRFVEARRIVCFLCRRSGMTWEETSTFINAQHPAACHHAGVVEDSMEVDPSYRKRVADLARLCGVNIA